MSKRSCEDNGKNSKIPRKHQKIGGSEQSEDSNGSNKNMLNECKKTDVPILISPPMPSRPNSKHDFNFWKKTDQTNVQFNSICISELNLGMCLNQTIRFRVSFKSGKKSCKNGDMFTFHIADNDGEMQVTVFPTKTTSFFDLIEFNRTYELTNFNVKKEETNFPLFVGNRKYICLLNSSKIDAIADEFISDLTFNFVPINKIKDLEMNSKCDVIGVIAKNWGKEIVGNNKVKRDVVLTDKSKECIILSLWGEEYDDFESEEITVIIHNGLVHDYNGLRSITCSPRTLFWRNPNTDAATELKLWFDIEKTS